MSSFTDEIVKFNPYVDTLRADDAIQIGMIKQQQYEQGVQKVQGFIDSVKGIDVVRDVDKTYLDQRLQQLRGEVGHVLSSDFSRNQLINQIGGLAGKISSDPYVKNAMLSTQKYKSQVQRMEKDRSEGKLQVANEAVFAIDSNKWLQSNDIKGSYNAQYTPYSDYKKKAIEALKALKPDVNISDNALITGPDGKLTIADATIRNEFTGISPQKIQEALYSTLDTNDFKQMEIEGRYSYMGKNSQDLKSIAEDRVNRSLTDIYTQRNKLRNAMASLTSIPEKNKLSAQIDALNDREKSLNKEGDFYINNIGKNDEAIKAQLYTNDFLHSFSNAFSFTELKQTEVPNIHAQMQLEREKLNQTWKIHLADFAQEEEHFKLNYEQKDRELKIAADKKKKEDGEAGYGGVPGTIDQSQLPTVSVSTITADTEGKINQIKVDEQAFLTKMGHDASWLREQEALLAQKPASVSQVVKDYINKKESVQNQIDQSQLLLKELREKADKDPSLRVSTLIPKDAPSIKYKDMRGEFIFTPQEFAEFNGKVESFKKTEGTYSFGSYGSSPRYTTLDETKKASLPTKERILFDIYKKNYEGKPLSKGEKAIADNLENYRTKVNLKSGGIIEKRVIFMNEELLKRSGETQRTAFEIPAGKGEDRASARTLANNYLRNAADQKESTGSQDPIDYDAAKKLNSSSNSTYSVVVKGKTALGEPKYWLRLSGADDKGNPLKDQDIPLTPEQKRTTFGQSYEGTPQHQAFREVEQQMMATGRGSTNFNLGKTDKYGNEVAHATAYLTKNNFRNVSMFNVKGDVIEQDGGYSLRLYVADPKDPKGQMKSVDYTPPTGLMDKTQVIETMAGLSDVDVYGILYGHIPTADELKGIENTNKKAY